MGQAHQDTRGHLRADIAGQSSERGLITASALPPEPRSPSRRRTRCSAQQPLILHQTDFLQGQPRGLSEISNPDLPKLHPGTQQLHGKEGG